MIRLLTGFRTFIRLYGIALVSTCVIAAPCLAQSGQAWIPIVDDAIVEDCSDLPSALNMYAGKNASRGKVKWQTTIIAPGKTVHAAELMVFVNGRICKLRKRRETSGCSCSHGDFPFHYSVEILEAMPVADTLASTAGSAGKNYELFGTKTLKKARKLQKQHLALCSSLEKSVRNLSVNDGQTGHPKSWASRHSLYEAAARQEKRAALVEDDVNVKSIYGDWFELETSRYTDDANVGRPSLALSSLSVKCLPGGPLQVASLNWWHDIDFHSHSPDGSTSVYVSGGKLYLAAANGEPVCVGEAHNIRGIQWVRQNQLSIEDSKCLGILPPAALNEVVAKQ